MTYFYRYECKGIQDWILSGNKLRDIAAASELIDALPAKLNSAVANAQVVVAAAGKTTLAFDSLAGLQAFASALPMRVAEAAPDLHVVHAWTHAQDGLLDRAANRRLEDGLRRDRQRLFARLPEAGPMVELASRTGNPAVQRKEFSPDRGSLLDAAAVVKGNEQQSNLQKRVGRSDLTFAKDDKELACERVAVIHADGNGLGQWIMNQEWTTDQLRDFSAKLTEATEEAFRAATSKLNAKLHGPKILPLRPIVVGGDDVTVLMDGKHAFDWLRDYLTAFKAETASRIKQKPEGFDACAGLVWCKPHWPYFQANALAESMCKAAKAALRRNDGSAPSAMLFYRVSGSSETDWNTICTTELANGRLSGGPWTLDVLDNLTKLSKAVAQRHIPRGALRGWIDLIRADGSLDAQAEQLWKRCGEVARDNELREKEWKNLGQLLEALGMQPGTGLSPSSSRARPGKTVLFDALTLARMRGELSSDGDEATTADANGAAS